MTADPPAQQPAPDRQALDRQALDAWRTLRAATPARIGLGRSGDTVPLRPVLDFQLAHAEARDAVHATLDVEILRAALAPRPSLVVASAAASRSDYLRRPDLGRTLDPTSQAALDAAAGQSCECVVVIADGLSALAVMRHAVPLLEQCLPRLTRFRLAPIVIASQGRVALGDSVGERLGADLCVMLIGERPGLSVADSLGVYITYAPRVGRRDSERNCISNIHARGGLSYARAADKLCWLAEQALSRRLTGVALKDEADPRTAAVADQTPPVLP